jgi:NAD(P)-dependent dehydrogenase (short-subunit alcohol dehydrogenase family)
MSSKKSIVITGASTGLGAAFTKALAQDGHDLFVCAREIDRLAMATTDLPAVFRAACDVASAAEVQTFFDQVRERSRFVDVLIHCAGVLGPVGPSIDIDSDAWFSAVKTNLFGAFLVTKHVVPLMQAERRPRIILLSGGGAFDPMPHVSAYAASKAAITRMA